VKDLHPALEEAYLMINGTPDVMNELTHLLYEGRWRSIRSGSDLNDCRLAVDMTLVNRAEVFVGNGVGAPLQSRAVK
jgi:hypothetical protein